MNYDDLLHDLDHLLRETFSLWDPGWVTFNWRAYTYDHTQRVRGLAMTLCQREGGDTRIVELAALLHDITKPYDGEYLVDENGKRVVDEKGYWRNEIRRPSRSNSVTELFEALGLAGRVHNESGAVLAYHLLRHRGVEPTVCERVAQTIAHHLLPPADAPIESRCLYDADTIDANIGLPAFIRNIYIHLHYYNRRKPPEAPTIEAILQESPLDYLRPYIQENLPQWAEGKRRDFIPKLQTEAGRTLAEARIERLKNILAWLSEELESSAVGDHLGIDVVLHYMSRRDDPSIAQETRYLLEHWLTPQTNGRTRTFVEQIFQEMQGII